MVVLHPARGIVNEKDIVILSLHVFLKEDVPMEQFHQVVLLGEEP